jgi:hypothetical protein
MTIPPPFIPFMVRSAESRMTRLRPSESFIKYSVNFQRRIGGIPHGPVPKLARPAYLEVSGAGYLVFDESARHNSDDRDALPTLCQIWRSPRARACKSVHVDAHSRTVVRHGSSPLEGTLLATGLSTRIRHRV